MTKKEKFELLKSFLKENKFDFIENYVSSRTGVVMDLRVVKFQIAVHLSDEHDQEFFEKLRGVYHPFFIRDSESPDFIIEKMQNCITDIMLCRQKHYENVQKRKDEKAIRESKTKEAVIPSKQKRKRQRIVKYEKV